MKKATSCIIPNISHSGKGRTVETVKNISDCQELEGERWTGSTLVGHTDNGRGCAGMVVGSMLEISLPFHQFCCKL